MPGVYVTGEHLLSVHGRKYLSGVGSPNEQRVLLRDMLPTTDYRHPFTTTEASQTNAVSKSLSFQV
jgi:hypothetical protein